MNYLICNNTLSKENDIRVKLEDFWQMPVEYAKFLNYCVYFTEKNSLLLTEKDFLLVDGFVYNYKTGKNLHDFKDDINTLNWPLSNDYTGMFASVLINKNHLIIVNDLLGILPLYYFQRPGEKELIITNSYLSLSIFPFTELDPVGVYQRRYSIQKITFGNRTIIKNLRRLLPGEFIEFINGEGLVRKYDNTLYDAVLAPVKRIKDVALSYYKFLNNEYKTALSEYNHVTVGLSGGIDSRLMLSCIPDGIMKELITYGSYEDEIEVRIAKALALKSPNSTFTFTEINNSHFPPEELVEDIIRKTEAYYINHWIPLYEMKKSGNDRGNILIGDMCEAVPGKFVSTAMDRSNKIKNIIKGSVYTPSSAQHFDRWSKNMISEELNALQNQKQLAFLLQDHKEILDSSREDLITVIERVKAHNPPLTELYTELYKWFTYIRMLHAKQYLIHKNNLDIINPTLFFNNLRTISNIHPIYRVNYRLMDAIFKNFSRARRFGTLPVAQAPFIPYNSPRVLRLLLWGLRAKADRYLIRRKVRFHSQKMRYRLFKSLDWPKIYKQPDALSNLQKMVENDYVNAKSVVDTFSGRRSLHDWPLASFDINLIVALNQEIKLFHNAKAQLYR